MVAQKESRSEEEQGGAEVHKASRGDEEKEVSKPVCNGLRTAVKKRTFDEALEALSTSEEDRSEDEYF